MRCVLFVLFFVVVLNLSVYVYINSLSLCIYSFITKCQWNVLTGPLMPVQFNDVKKIHTNSFMGKGNNRERPAG